MEQKVINLYVSLSGSDKNDGSKEMPFLTPERAIEEIAKINGNGLNGNINVYFAAGNYSVKGMCLTKEHSGTKAYSVNFVGEKNTVFNGGKNLDSRDFVPVTDEKIRQRLKPEARDSVRVLDLKKYGITAEDIGNIYTFGTATSAASWDDDTVGANAELFWGGVRMTMARYPNDSYTEVAEVLDHGDNPKEVKKNPKGGTIRVNDEVKAEMKLWQEPEKAWVFGKFYWMWADDSTPVAKIDTDKGEITMKHLSTFDYKEGGVFYFFNILEELDSEGEYYIDRENMLLYAFPPKGWQNETPMISLLNELMLKGDDLENVSFEGIEFTGVRGDIANINGNHIRFTNCKFSSSYGIALAVNGWENIIYGCEACHMGKGGIRISGGDRNNLIHANSRIENCCVHDYGQIYRTYQQALWASGCGNYIIHNEVYNSPHLAISYHGNEHYIAYNYVHDVVLESHDAGALYIGGDWTSVGNLIQYNLFRNIGKEGTFCSAIYFDDGMSGQTAKNNIVINCSGPAFLVGGGRENIVVENMLIDCETGFFYDDRYCHTGYCPLYKAKPGTGMWTTLDRVPYHTELWKKKYPLLDKITTDFDRYLDKDFPANPSYSLAQYNLFVDNKHDMALGESILRYSEVKDNYPCPRDKVDIANGTYSVDEEFIREKNIEWEQLPMDKIGCCKT